MDWQCGECGFVYRPVDNDGVTFYDLPGDWTDPVCGAYKDNFTQL
jgi:rubredoxin